MIFALVLLFWMLFASYLPFHYRHTKFVQGWLDFARNWQYKVLEFFRDLCVTYVAIWGGVYHADFERWEKWADSKCSGPPCSNASLLGAVLFLATVVLLVTWIVGSLVLSFIISFA